MSNPQMDKMPEIYCAILVSFPQNTDIQSVSNSLKQIGIDDYTIYVPKCSPEVCIKMATVGYESFWYLDEALTKMFLHVDNCLDDLKKVIKRFHGQTCIDVAFYQYGTYPALEFSGENMKKIRSLEADISIDPYSISADPYYKLVETLKLLASAPDIQLSAIPEQVCPDKIAFYLKELIPLLEYFKKGQVIATTVSSRIEEINHAFLSFQKEDWTEVALTSSPKWEKIRAIAVSILDSLGEKAEAPDLDW